MTKVLSSVSLLQIDLHFGPLAERLSVQLKRQGIVYDKDIISSYEKLGEYVTHLAINNLLTTKQAKASQTKLFKKVISHLKKKNKWVK